MSPTPTLSSASILNKNLFVNSAINNIAPVSSEYANRKGRYVSVRRGLAVGALAAGLVVCWRAAEMRPTVLLFPGTTAAIWAFVRSLFPPDLSPDFLRVAGAAIIRTAAMAIAGTTLAIAIGLPLAVMSTPTLWQRGILLAGERLSAATLALGWVSRSCRALLGFMRAVPDLMWALLFVVAVGLGSLAGVLALAVSYGG